jgi:hypothetical protein
MAELVINRIQGLALSAQDLSAMTNWPDALIEDYLAILRNLIDLAEFIDIDIAEIERLTQLIESYESEAALRFASLTKQVKRLFDAFQEIAALRSEVGLLRSRVVKLQNSVFDIQQEVYA